MNHESANNRCRQSTVNIVTRLQVVKLTELGLIPRKRTNVSSCTNIPTEYGAHTRHYTVGAGNKVSRVETDKNVLHPR